MPVLSSLCPRTTPPKRLYHSDLADRSVKFRTVPTKAGRAVLGRARRAVPARSAQVLRSDASRPGSWFRRAGERFFVAELGALFFVQKNGERSEFSTLFFSSYQQPTTSNIQRFLVGALRDDSLANIGDRFQEPVSLFEKESNQLFFCYTKMVCNFQ